MKKGLVLFLSSLIFILLSISGCGGGSSSTTTIVGQATLGPLSNADIIISDFSGNILSSFKAKVSNSDLSEAGKFDIDINSSKLPDIFLITASGGIDIDALDDGNTNNQIDNNGTIHAIVTKDYLLNGNIIINPLTELLYDLTLDRFGDDLSTIKKDDIVAFLDAEAKNYLTLANATYKDILNFNPRLNKATSKIPWQKVLSLVVEGIHKGESSFTIRDKFSIVKTFTKEDGITKSENNSTFEQLSDDTDGNRVITKIQKDEDNTTVSTFTQKFMTKNGEIIDIFVKKINDDYSYLKATVGKDNHVFKIEGKTTLLQGLSFEKNSISNFVNSLISVETGQDSSLKITIDKQLATRLSDNEVKIYIDGRVPTDEELSVIADDPIVNWSWKSTNKLSMTIVLSNYDIANQPDTHITTLKNGLLAIDIPKYRYDQISGLQSERLSILKEGISNLIFDAITSIPMSSNPAGALISMYSFASDLKFVVTCGVTTAIEGTPFVNTSRVALIGRFDKQNRIIPGEEYYPVILIRSGVGNIKPTNLILSAFVDNHEPFRHSVGQITLKNNRGYIIIPSETVSFEHGGIISSSNIILKVESNMNLLMYRSNRYQTSLENIINIPTSIAYNIVGNQVWLFGETYYITPSQYLNYTWEDNGKIIGTTQDITINIDNLAADKNGYGYVTLKTSGPSGAEGKKTVVISGLRTSNTNILIDEDFESGVLGDKMSISKKGTFKINPSIKNVSTLGGSKTFGFGESTCVASCSTSYQSSLKINFDKTTYVGDISFKVMELYGDWGSLGAIYIDGVQQDLFRQTTNTHNADNQYSNYSYSINKYVNEIELRVWDITDQSELFIDDLKITN